MAQKSEIILPGVLALLQKLKEMNVSMGVVTGNIKKAGYHAIQLGSESGSQRVLNYLDKNISVEVQGRAIELIKKNGILNDASFMVGIPIETFEELKMTEQFIKRYKPEIPDDILLPAAERLFRRDYYQTKIKKALYWAKRGELKYLAKKTLENIFIRFSSAANWN